jgi:hypothetical protein
MFFLNNVYYTVIYYVKFFVINLIIRVFTIADLHLNSFFVKANLFRLH